MPLTLLQVESTSLINQTFTSGNILGWILSSLVCILLTVFFYPYLDERFQTFVVRKLSFLGISTRHKIAGKWTHRWHVVSSSFESINEVKSAEIKQFRKKIFARYQVVDKQGKSFTYQMLGTVDKDQIITGIWRDIQKGNRYHGCFQIYIDVNEQKMIGIWTGLSRESKIKSGKWEWVRE